eukprot:CAMPEP_0170400508 /NCGR_PEP_ID=MMETSP0117_2-20130122/24538_1 /TAXON_ID=400756 /ORGANISM="Durinskia baltica, Strain CSIRO CS-38" /LENGTH=956 /DNA_ID=CAMNT_0010657267 /DNA_START=440 /DNA_END=3310 /DNA_ORIENTATION=-
MMMNSPIDKLVSFAVSAMYRYGSVEDAAQFWIRMTSSGFKVDKIGMNKLLDRLVGSTWSSPSLQLINSLHSAMRVNLWTQSPAYYVKMHKVLRQHISSQCKDSNQLSAAMGTLDVLWADSSYDCTVSDPAVAGLTGRPTSLHYMRLACYSAAIQAARRSQLARDDSVVLKCRSDAMNAFQVLAERGLGSHSGDGMRIGCDDNAIRAITKAVQSMLITPPTGTESAKESSLDTFGGASYFSLNSSHGDERKALHHFLTELCAEGSATDASTLLSTLLKARNTVAPSITADKKPESFYSATTKPSVGLSALLKSLRSPPQSSLASPAPRSAADIDASYYRANERTWQANLVCDMMRNTIAVESVDKGEGGGRSVHSVFAHLEKVFLELKQLLFSYQLKPGTQFYVAFIEALRNNMKTLALEERRNRLKVNDGTCTVPSIVWVDAFKVAQQCLADTPDSVKYSPDIVGELLALLCQSSGSAREDGRGVLEALKVLTASLDRGEHVPLSSLTSLLQGAIDSLGDLELCRVLVLVESSLEARGRSGVVGLDDRAGTVGLLRTRIFAHCRLREGFQALRLLQELKGAGEWVNARTYRWLILALHNATAETHKEWGILKHPSDIVNFFVREMRHDGHHMNKQTLALLLRLYTRSIQLADTMQLREQLQEEMDSFLKTHSGRNSKLVSEEVLRELIKVRCIADDTEGATELLKAAEIKYGIKPTMYAYEPLIFHNAVIRGDLNAAEDIMMTQVSVGVLVTESVVAAFAVGLMRHGERSEALDCIQDMFNQYKVRAPVPVWTGLLDESLANGDVMEARRIVFLLKQLYTPKERAGLMGCAAPAASNSLRSAVGGTLGGSVVDQPHLHAPHHQKEDEDDVKKTPKLASKRLEKREEVIASYWKPVALRASELRRQRNGSEEKLDAPENVPGYLLKIGAPMGLQERGVLSDEGLQRRFACYDFELDL